MAATKAQRLAWSRVSKAVKSGRLPAPTSLPCEVCFAQAKEYHHPSGYEGKNALVVAALCKQCHERLHADRTYAQIKRAKSFRYNRAQRNAAFLRSLGVRLD